MSARRILLADDSPLARRAVRSLLKQEDTFEVIGEAQDGFEALEMAKDLMPDLILMDINMPGCDGLTATRMVKRELPYATVVVLTVSGEAADLFEAIRSGAQGYLLKSLDPGIWLECLRAVADGEAMPQEIARLILGEFSAPEPQAAPPERSAQYPGLSPRERQVLRLVGEAQTNRQVADTLFISEQTVKNHIRNILDKLHLKNRVELALRARDIANSSRARDSRGLPFT